MLLAKKQFAVSPRGKEMLVHESEFDYDQRPDPTGVSKHRAGLNGPLMQHAPARDFEGKCRGDAHLLSAPRGYQARLRKMINYTRNSSCRFMDKGGRLRLKQCFISDAGSAQAML